MEPVEAQETSDLVDACRRGDRIAQHALYQKFAQRVRFIAIRMVGRNEADDVAQNVFLQAFRCLGQYRNDARFETWLYRLTVNEALQYRRRNRRWPFPSLNEELLTAPPDSNGQGEERELLDRALSKLPPDLRIVFVLREVDDLSYRDVAEVVGIPEGTVASKLSRARQELREIMTALGWEG